MSRRQCGRGGRCWYGSWHAGWGIRWQWGMGCRWGGCESRRRSPGCGWQRGRRGCLAGGLGVESCGDLRFDGGFQVGACSGDLRFDGGFYIDLRVVAAGCGQEDGRGERGQEEFADHAGSCI